MKERASIKIFLVDDEPYCLNLYDQYLQNLGCRQIQQFSRSPEFLERLQDQPDLIMLDYNMETFNGIDILKKIKRFNPDVPVVFISGQEEIGVAVNALKYGAFDYIIKDEVNEQRLELMLEKLKAFHHMLDRKRRRDRIKRIFTSLFPKSQGKPGESD